MKSLSVLFILFLCMLEAQASFIASNNSKLNPNLPTHVMVAGHPDDLGELFIYSLVTRAKIYLEKSHNEQILIVGRSQDKDAISVVHGLCTKYCHALLSWGWREDMLRDLVWNTIYPWGANLLGRELCH